MVEQRFWGRVEKTDYCWNWIGAKLNKEYGQFWVDGKKCLAHRFSWVLHFGAIPKGSGYHGTCVLHKCDNPACVNPDHLFLGSNLDNVRDMIKKGRHRTNPLKGEKRPQAKLTEIQVREILKDERKNIKIAEDYNVNYRTISAIKHGTRWAHVTL